MMKQISEVEDTGNFVSIWLVVRNNILDPASFPNIATIGGALCLEKPFGYTKDIQKLIRISEITLFRYWEQEFTLDLF